MAYLQFNRFRLNEPAESLSPLESELSPVPSNMKKIPAFSKPAGVCMRFRLGDSNTPRVASPSKETTKQDPKPMRTGPFVQYAPSAPTAPTVPVAPTASAPQDLTGWNAVEPIVTAHVLYSLQSRAPVEIVNILVQAISHTPQTGHTSLVARLAEAFAHPSAQGRPFISLPKNQVPTPAPSIPRTVTIQRPRPQDATTNQPSPAPVVNQQDATERRPSCEIYTRPSVDAYQSPSEKVGTTRQLKQSHKNADAIRKSSHNKISSTPPNDDVSVSAASPTSLKRKTDMGAAQSDTHSAQTVAQQEKPAVTEIPLKRRRGRPRKGEEKNRLVNADQVGMSIDKEASSTADIAENSVEDAGDSLHWVTQPDQLSSQNGVLGPDAQQDAQIPPETTTAPTEIVTGIENVGGAGMGFDEYAGQL